MMGGRVRVGSSPWARSSSSSCPQRRRASAAAALLSLCVLLCCGAAAAGGAQQEAAASMPHLDLSKATIKPKLSALPAEDKVLVEFFASWCPACRAFKPDYEKAAAFILANSKVHVFRLDCAADPDVCDAYKVAGYPTMYVGSAADVAAASVDKLTRFDYGSFPRTAAGVVAFVAKATQQPSLVYSEDAAKAAAAAAAAQGPGSSSSSQQGAAAALTAQQAAAAAAGWTAADVEAATRQLFGAITAFHPTEGLKQRRAALLLLLQFWAAGHPVPACKDGAAALLQQLPTAWPEDATSDPWGPAATAAATGTAALLPRDVCAAAAGSAKAAAAAPSVDASSWAACKGSSADSRGFTCGLWLLFHTAAARLPEADGGALLVSALRGFAEFFFQCEVCRKHFMGITNAPEAASVRSRREGVLWLWRVHNAVNGRLATVESKYGHSSSGDPAFPKQQWPSAAACPQCRLPLLPSERAGAAAEQAGGSPSSSSSGDAKNGSAQQQQQHGANVRWNEEEVYRFLMKHYGRQPGSAASLVGAAAAGQPGAQRSNLYPPDLGSSAAGISGSGGGVRGFASSHPGLLLLLAVAAVGGVAARQQLLGAVGLGGKGGRGGSGGRHASLKGPGMFARSTAGHYASVLPRHTHARAANGHSK